MHTNHRFLNSGSITTAVIAASLLTANRVGAQVPNPSPADGYTVPRTPDGQPDFEGFWSNATYTPLQRRDGVSGEFYTAEEVAAIEARALERESAQTVPGTRADVHYDFTQFGLDRSQATLATGLRTSLISDPPDGRIPSLLPLAQKRYDAIRAARARPAHSPVDRGVAERLFQLAGGLVEASVEIDVGIRGPELFPQILAGDDLAGPFDKQGQQAEGLLLQPDLEAALAQFACG